MIRQVTDWETIFAKHISNKELSFKKHKLFNSIIRKKIKVFKTSNKCFNKRGIGVSNTPIKNYPVNANENHNQMLPQTSHTHPCKC